MYQNDRIRHPEKSLMYQNDRIRHPEKSLMYQDPAAPSRGRVFFMPPGVPAVFFCSGFQERGFVSAGAFRKSTLR